MNPEQGMRFSSDVAVKWGLHARGESRKKWGMNRQATTLSVLINGKFRISFVDHEVVLASLGDSVIWAPEVAHFWVADEASTLLTVRWPSLVKDNVDLHDTSWPEKP